MEGIKKSPWIKGLLYALILIGAYFIINAFFKFKLYIEGYSSEIITEIPPMLWEIIAKFFIIFIISYYVIKGLVELIQKLRLEFLVKEKKKSK